MQVLVFRAGENAVFQVEDNGSGISEEELQKIRERLREPEDLENMHGLQNVYDRMRLLFGDAVEMEVEPAAVQGTRVIIRVPISKRQEGGRSHV